MNEDHSEKEHGDEVVTVVVVEIIIIQGSRVDSMNEMYVTQLTYNPLLLLFHHLITNHFAW
jgi:hypothetical protein